MDVTIWARTGRQVIAPRPRSPADATSLRWSVDDESRCYASTSIALTVVITVAEVDLVRYQVYAESTSLVFEHAKAQHVQFEDAALLTFAAVLNEAVRAMRQARAVGYIGPRYRE